VERAAPAGCAYWRAAAEGRVFYTEAADHYNCPIASYTHGVALPDDRAGELEGVVGTMVGLQYIRMEEVPTLPRRAEPFGVAIYAPLADTPVEPDAVCWCAAPRAKSCWWRRRPGPPGSATMDLSWGGPPAP
jgi:uncharacterized protein (DUF169 family)